MGPYSLSLCHCLINLVKFTHFLAFQLDLKFPEVKSYSSEISCCITNHSNIQWLKIKIIILLSLIISVGREFRKLSGGQCWPWSHAIAIRQWQEQLGAGWASCFQEFQGLSMLGTLAFLTAWQPQGSGTSHI